MRRVNSLARAAAMLAVGAALWGGCKAPPQPPSIGFSPASAADLLKLRQVVLVELDCEGNWPAIAEGMTDALFRAIQDRKLFAMRQVRRQDPLCRDLPLRVRQPYTIQELALLQKTLQCDAVLLGCVQDFQPHPRMQLGVYLVLLDLNDGKAIWGVDHTWDSTDDWTVRRIRQFFRTHMRAGYEPVDWQMALRSPRVFQKFVAQEIADTLPSAVPLAPRQGPLPVDCELKFR